MTAEAAKYLGAGIAAGLGMIGPGLGLGVIGYGTMSGIARNPEAGSKMFVNMILMAGLTEAIGIYALIVAIILSMVV
ncbi:MAG: ATP synthase F0 subunit C [Dehalococcoidales bacterium]|jgi:F-type H+-transporting ATPase subunit c|nr:ATP synthase F0 subunit C [Dehalococcoidales bacterium]